MGKGTPPSRRCWARLEWKGALELVGVNNEIGEEEPKREGEEVLELSFLRLVSFPFFFFFLKGTALRKDGALRGGQAVQLLVRIHPKMNNWAVKMYGNLMNL